MGNVSKNEYRDRIMKFMDDVQVFIDDDSNSQELIEEAKDLYDLLDESLVSYPKDLSLESVMKIEQNWRLKFQIIINKVDSTI